MLVPDPRALLVEPSFDTYKLRVQSLILPTPFLPEAIVQEQKKLCDFLALCYFKYDLLDLAQLYAVMLFEKAMRIKLEPEYKNISKIKLSVLLDRAKQLALLAPDQVVLLRSLKDFRNRGVHATSEVIDASIVFTNIEVLMKAIDSLFIDLRVDMVIEK